MGVTDHDLDPPEAPEGEPGSTITAGPAVDEPGSVRALLRERWEALKEDKTIDLEIPGVPGDVLQVRYGPLPNEELKKLQKRGQAPGASAMAVNADTLIRACQAILVPVSADEEAPLDTLTDDEGDPIVFDVRLAEFLGFGDEVKSAREVVYRLFSKAPQPDMAIGSQALRVMRWMEGEQTGAADKLLDF
jgi:hypothetical protein